MNQSIIVYFSIALALLVGLAFYFPRLKFLTYIAVTGMFILASSLYFTMENYKGWPTANNFGKAYIMAIEIQEPNPDQNFDGAIYVWLIENDVATSNKLMYNPGNNVPRSHYIKYTPQSGKAFAKAKELLKKGYVVQTGESTKATGQGKDHPGDFEFEYETDKPKITAINPQDVMQKNE